MKIFRLLLIIAFLAGCATGEKENRRGHAHPEDFTKHYEKSLLRVTEKGLFSVEMVIKDHDFTMGVNEVDLIIHDKDDKDVVGADIVVTPWMPEMGHGVFEQPVIHERGGGLYSVENIVLSMSGHWEIRVGIQKDSQKDSAIFDFPGVETDRGHKHAPATKPGDLDLSTRKYTENKTFLVSYESSLEPISINTIHSWIITVQNADGNPVVNAHMTISGDMPQHGHGLPTQPEVTEPEVTQSLGSGSYRVDGVKFNMPGWWTIDVTIETNAIKDMVTFNLLIPQ